MSEEFGFRNKHDKTFSENLMEDCCDHIRIRDCKDAQIEERTTHFADPSRVKSRAAPMV